MQNIASPAQAQPLSISGRQTDIIGILLVKFSNKRKGFTSLSGLARPAMAGAVPPALVVYAHH
ncbi:hypothetical protein [Vibrio taketomensis]|uniref:hypothetical protein n=1 Tax=Vibrio taketomensis TaxID=2572923 RepID=UPI0039E8D8AE